MERKIITTNDGSKTIFIPEWNENYHSKHGALQEAMHVFIESGFRQMEQEELNVLEVGFGSGLNAILTYIEAEKENKKVNYHGLEGFPISQEEFDALSYGDIAEIADVKDVLNALFAATWNEENQITTAFTLEKTEVLLADFSPQQNKYNLIYFDAFGPRVQPHMWTLDILEKMFTALDHGGVFVTYCAKGQVRRDLIQLGFNVEKIPGPPGKREMLRAIKP